jgi:hypothetical protein
MFHCHGQKGNQEWRMEVGTKLSICQHMSVSLGYSQIDRQKLGYIRITIRIRLYSDTVIGDRGGLLSLLLLCAGWCCNPHSLLFSRYYLLGEGGASASSIKIKDTGLTPPCTVLYIAMI